MFAGIGKQPGSLPTIYLALANSQARCQLSTWHWQTAQIAKYAKYAKSNATVRYQKFKIIFKLYMLTLSK
jgi:hypothetical protein